MRYLKQMAFLFIIVSSLTSDASAINVKDGDIIFHTSRSLQSVAIQRATGSRYSHMGIIFFKDGKPYVFEAIKTVQYTRLDKWISRGEGKHFVVKRLRDSEQILNKHSLEKIRVEAVRYQGKPYDLTFEWSDDKIYCSELVWKIYKRALGIQIGNLQKLSDFNLSDPVVKKKMKERYGSKIPLEEPVISPGEMFNAPNLFTVSRQ